METIISRFDLIIGAVLIPGSQAPKILQKKHLGLMKPGSVVVDVAIDQGGCFETVEPLHMKIQHTLSMMLFIIV